MIQALMGWLLPLGLAMASSDEHPQHREYAPTPPAPAFQTQMEANAKSAGCVSCHTQTDQFSMHQNPGVVLGCTDCHGGDARIVLPPGVHSGEAAYTSLTEQAHVLPLYPESWHYPDSATAKETYSLLNLESPEFIRFINPGDYRVARDSCGACHLPEILAAERSLMATGAMLWGGASYNNGILPFKHYVLGESYQPLSGEEAKEAAHNGELITLGATIKNPIAPDAAMQAKGVLAQLAPMPTWEALPPADIFRVFERGGRNIGNLFPETGLPNALGQIQRLEEPGRPDIRQSNRGPGTGARIAVPVINIYKTRLNDPFTWFMGTNDQPGDYRSSGCSACHVIYSNDRDPDHSGPYARFGHDGTTQSVDPTIARNEPGHPLKHEFTRAIPTSQCMICHMHQPNVFVNSYLGYTMWDYESDAPSMWPDKQRYVSQWDVLPGTKVQKEQIVGHDKAFEILQRNPEEAATRGLWGDLDFLKQVADLNPKLNDTQFADYHGHGWNFRAVFKRDRAGNLLDAQGHRVADDDPHKFDKAVHLSSVHMDVGMHCVDCHFTQDAHGNGHIYGEVAQAVEIDCVDCHGTVKDYPTLRTSGPAAPPGGTDLSLLRTQDGRPRFEWRQGRLFQRAALYPDREWEVSLVKDSVNPNNPHYNPKAARAKTMSRDPNSQSWGPGVNPKDWAHPNEEMTCFACHSSWATSCAGCHLPIQANWKTRRHHYDRDETRNFATYNPQVARDQMYQLGRHGPAKGGRIAPVRSSSALVLSSRNSNRELIYIQQPPIAASGFSSQAFAPHFPHTVRKTETKTCSDCHLSQDNDNNAIMAQLLLLGTNFVNFVGYNAWVGTDDAIEAVRVTEWDEPQAVIGSYLDRYAYPDWYKQHQERNRVLQEAYDHKAGDSVGCLQLRGEYLYVAQGKQGMEAYDVANIANKGFSQRFITAPFSPLGHNTRIKSRDATCVALPTNQPIHPQRRHQPGFGLTAAAMTTLMNDANQEQDFHPIYNYALITDAEEGLILTDINTLADGEPRNNFLERALTWNENGVLNGARHITIGGHYVYIAADAGLVILNMDQPLQPKVAAVVKLDDVRASALQFRYLFVTDRGGLRVIDVTHPEQPKLVPDAWVPMQDAHRIYVARTYAYVAAGPEGLAIIDVTQPERPKLYQRYSAQGQLNDARDVIVGTTNASLFAYVADGRNGLKVLQLTSPEIQPRFYGYSPEPNPQLIATYPTQTPALSLSKGLDRDRAVDETGHQIAVFGRLGSRPFNLEEMQRMYLDDHGKPWTVKD
ncbi:MAG: hypothetical protein H6970_07490 [Gammaproteobacteria bacterium]|nr:hypothetical protein [Gammaproteobacteria bacterium]MCP5424897.1 hypothetical protein [Gammaproteobacteria bacterium]MCP5458127.1 hypothetical protein [Gammaproteobacteria bacterium]